MAAPARATGPRGSRAQLVTTTTKHLRNAPSAAEDAGRQQLERVRNRLKREIWLRKLNRLRRGTDDVVFVDYGWIRLLFTGDGDLQELYYHMNCRPWYEHDMRVFRQHIRPGDSVVDIGANLGFVTTMLAELVGVAGRVYAFEPADSPYRKLEMTLRANGLSQVRTYKAGCGRETRTETLHKISPSSGNSSILGDGSGEQITVVPLDSVQDLQNQPIQFLKIDTEGYEPEVLMGAERLISSNRPVIWTELGGGYLESTMRAIELLKAYGYPTSHVNHVDWSTVVWGTDFLFLPGGS